jgi:type IV pilus assembly protein PilC
MLDTLADYYEEEVEVATEALMAALEPLMIIMLAGVCGVIIGAVLAPMASMYQGLDAL